MLIGLVSSRLSLRRLHVLEIGGNSLGDGETLAATVFLNGLDARAIRFQFESFATRAAYDFGAIFNLLALSSVLPPLAKLVSLGMNPDFAAHPNLVAELTV